MTPPSRRPAYVSRYSKLYQAGYRMTADSRTARRQVQALMAIGYTRALIAEESGISRSFVDELAHQYDGTTRVRHEIVAKVAAAYERLHMQPRDDTAARKVKTYARKNGYTPPLGWDDIETDVLPHVRVKGMAA